MRIAYISSIAYADLDLSLVQALSKYAEVDYYMVVGHGRKSTAMDFSSTQLESGVTRADKIDGLEKFSNWLNLSKTFVICSSAKRGFTLTSFIMGWRMYKRLQEEKYDIVHVTTAPSYYSWFMYLLRKKLVITVHDPIPHSSAKGKLTELMRRVAFKIIKNIILLNNSQRLAFIERYGLSTLKKNMLVSRLGPYNYLQFFNNESEGNFDGNYILYFGNIVSYKGLDYLFPAMEKIHNVDSSIKLVVAGRGEYYFDISKYQGLNYFDIRNRFVPNEELSSLIRNALFVVVPYIDATQSGVVMSAFAFNKPCIVTNVGGLPEMVQDGRHGIVVSPKDTDALAEAMVHLIKNVELRKEFERNIGEDYCQGVKSWDYICKELFEYYNLIISQK